MSWSLSAISPSEVQWFWRIKRLGSFGRFSDVLQKEVAYVYATVSFFLNQGRRGILKHNVFYGLIFRFWYRYFHDAVPPCAHYTIYSRCIFDKIWQKNTGFSRPEEILERFNCQTTDTLYFIKRKTKQLKIKQWKTTKLKIKKY